MATLRKIIYDIREVAHNYSSDSNITDEYLAYQVNIARALLLEQKFSSRSFVIPEKIRQHFHYDLELSNDNDFATDLGVVLRTKDPIQKPLEPYNFKSTVRINGGSLSDTNFSFVLPERFPYVGRNKWVQNQIYVTIGSDFRLYFISNGEKYKMLENIKLSIVAENPEEAYPYTISYDSNVDFWDVEYPLEENMVTKVTDLIIKKIVDSLKLPEDKRNDATDEES